MATTSPYLRLVSSNGSGPTDPEDPKALSTRLNDVEKKVDHVINAIYGDPLDSEDNGLTGEVRQMKKDIIFKFDRLFQALWALVGTIIIAGVTLAVALH